MTASDTPVTTPRAFHLDAGPVVLRDFTPADVDDAFAIVGDDRVTQWLSFDSRDRDGAARMIQAAIAAARQEPRTEYYVGIAETSTDRLVGFARLALSGVRASKLGYAIHADHWGQGYATQAVRALVEFGVGELKLHRITAAIGPDNAQSIAIVERLGFAHEGRLRDHVYTNGAWRDSHLFALIAHELRTNTLDHKGKSHQL